MLTKILDMRKLQLQQKGVEQRETRILVHGEVRPPDSCKPILIPPIQHFLRASIGDLVGQSDHPNEENAATAKSLFESASRTKLKMGNRIPAI